MLCRVFLVGCIALTGCPEGTSSATPVVLSFPAEGFEFVDTPIDVGSVLGTVLATPSDGTLYNIPNIAANEHVYSRFIIDAESGDIIASAPLQEDAEYILTVRAIHNDLNTNTAVRINTASGGITPTFMSQEYLLAAVTANAGTELGQVAAEPLDGTRYYIPYIAANMAHGALFAMDSESGLVTIDTTLEHNHIYSIVVRAINGSKSTDIPMSIIVYGDRFQRIQNNGDIGGAGWTSEDETFDASQYDILEFYYKMGYAAPDFFVQIAQDEGQGACAIPATRFNALHAVQDYQYTLVKNDRWQRVRILLPATTTAHAEMGCQGNSASVFSTVGVDLTQLRTIFSVFLTAPGIVDIDEVRLINR